MTDVDATRRVRFTMSGEIDAATARNGIALLLSADPCPRDTVTLDMSEVDFIDSSGVSMLSRMRSYLDGMECRFALTNPSAPVIRVLALLGLTETFPIDDA